MAEAYYLMILDWLARNAVTGKRGAVELKNADTFDLLVLTQPRSIVLERTDLGTTEYTEYTEVKTCRSDDPFPCVRCILWLPAVRSEACFHPASYVHA